MNSIGKPVQLVGATVLFFASAVLAVGVFGLALTLVFRTLFDNADRMHDTQVYSLALVSLGLATGGATLLRRQREGNESRQLAQRLSQFHAAMSQTNRLILRRPDPCELLEGVCQICIGAGRLDLAVVDMLELGEAHRASAEVSPDGTLATAPRSLPGGARLQSRLTTLVTHTEQCIIVDDAMTDERLQGATAWCAAQKMCSFAALPLRRSGILVGVLLLCSRTRKFFSGGVAPLLSELGADVSFALDNADRERERHGALLADHARVTAEDANRAKNEFLAQMSHEVRTPSMQCSASRSCWRRTPQTCSRRHRPSGCA